MGYYYQGYIPGYSNNNYYYSSYNYKKYKSIRKPGVMGLKNLNASSCYMNASIQCLVHLEGFYTSIACKKSIPKESLLYEINNFIKEMTDKNNEKKSYSPTKIREAMGKVDVKYLLDRQRDANEFISNCIMEIHDETKSKVKKI